MSAEPRIILAPYDADPLSLLAERLLDEQAAALPDLSAHAVLLPGGGAPGRFRSILAARAAARGHAALLPPWIGTFSSWLETFAPPATRNLTNAARELLLLDALQDFADLKSHFGAWPLVDSLLALFDELALHIGRLPASSEEFQQALRDGYRVTASIAPLDAEADRVYTLWTAWNQYLADQGLADQARNMRAALDQSLKEVLPHSHIYLAGIVEFTDAEVAWARTLQKRGQLTLLLHGQAGGSGYHPDSPLTELMNRLEADVRPAHAGGAFARWIDESFAPAGAVVRTRAHAFAAVCPHTPAAGRLGVFSAADLEHEARAIDLQVRRWRLEGRRSIGIVTDDRKLARRVRALLERANVPLHDSGGWALSTTSTATALIRWLECVEQRFAYAPLLDLLRSPFVTLNWEPRALAKAVSDLDRYIVRTQGIVAGMDDYRAGIAGAARTAARTGKTFGDVAGLLDRLAHAAAPLRPVVHADSGLPTDYMEAVVSSLERLGLLVSYRTDKAGTELLASLDELRRALSDQAIRISWTEFHHWLQRDIERRRFRSPLISAGVELMGLAESRCHRFDGVILAGCTRDHLPGGSAPSPFFNDAVRQHLGLPVREQRVSAVLYDFRRLLESAPNVLLTYRAMDVGEALLPSPWVERLNAFHKLAYDAALEDHGLAQLLEDPATLLTRREAPLPEPEQMPRVHLDRALLPHTISAGAYQRLMDCPYQFYAADALGLMALERVREEVDRPDYGQRVHRILQAFHLGIFGLPGPWRGGVTEITRAAAETLLREISRAVFADDMVRRFSARGWLYRWQAIIPAYLDWQQQRTADAWQVSAAELRLEQPLDTSGADVVLVGRIDRIDRGPGGDSIIDYKTGRLPDAGALTAGEQVQLPFYTLLVDNVVDEVLYLGLHDDRVDDTRRLSGAELSAVRDQQRARLTGLYSQIEGIGLPAWGDEKTCSYCSMEGMCRKQMWTDRGIKKAAMRPPFI